MDPRIRIRINPKMAWIRNTASNNSYQSITSKGLKEKNHETDLNETGIEDEDLLVLVLGEHCQIGCAFPR
jgi:hypothetical protein